MIRATTARRAGIVGQRTCQPRGELRGVDVDRAELARQAGCRRLSSRSTAPDRRRDSVREISRCCRHRRPRAARPDSPDAPADRPPPGLAAEVRTTSGRQVRIWRTRCSSSCSTPWPAYMRFQPSTICSTAGGTPLCRSGKPQAALGTAAAERQQRRTRRDRFRRSAAGGVGFGIAAGEQLDGRDHSPRWPPAGRRPRAARARHRCTRPARRRARGRRAAFARCGRHRW